MGPTHEVHNVYVHIVNTPLSRGPSGDRQPEHFGGMWEIGTFNDIATSLREWRVRVADPLPRSVHDGYFDWEELEAMEEFVKTTEELTGFTGQVLGINGLFLADNHLLSAVEGGMVWARLASVLDSGAAESVMPEKLLDWLPLEASEGFRRGATYTSASGQVISNLGARTVQGVTSDNLPISAMYQVCAVNKPLTSVAKVCEAGNKVVFEKDGGFIWNYASKTTTPFRKENGVYMMDMWVEAPADRVAQGFTRPSE